MAAPASELPNEFVTPSTEAKKDNITYKEALEDILYPGPQTVTQKIRSTLRKTPTAKSVGGGSKCGSSGPREAWVTAQLYDALSTSLLRPYTVELEYELNHRNRPTPDIHVESNAGDGDYVIEIKRASANLNGAKIGRQLQKYH